MQATLAFREAASGGPRERVRERSRRGLASLKQPAASSSHSSQRQAPGVALVWTDDLDEAEELFTALINAARYEHLPCVAFLRHARGVARNSLRAGSARRQRP